MKSNTGKLNLQNSGKPRNSGKNPVSWAVCSCGVLLYLKSGRGHTAYRAQSNSGLSNEILCILVAKLTEVKVGGLKIIVLLMPARLSSRLNVTVKWIRQISFKQLQIQLPAVLQPLWTKRMHSISFENPKRRTILSRLMSSKISFHLYFYLILYNGSLLAAFLGKTKPAISKISNKWGLHLY